jgi:hypothetical protein
MDGTPLHKFEKIVLASFGPVCADFGLMHVRSLIHGPECSITFENTVAGLTVYFEIGTGAWVQAGQVHRDQSGKVTRREFYDLSFFLNDRAPAEKRPARFDDVNDPGVAGAVDDLARQVRTYAADVLEGDFAVIPTIRERAKENLRITEARLYGRRPP